MHLRKNGSFHCLGREMLCGLKGPAIAGTELGRWRQSPWSQRDGGQRKGATAAGAHPALHVTAAHARARRPTKGGAAQGRGRRANSARQGRGLARARAPPAGRPGRIVPARQGRPGPALLLQRSSRTSSLPLPRYTVTARKKKKKNTPPPWPRHFISLLAFNPLALNEVFFPFVLFSSSEEPFQRMDSFPLALSPYLSTPSRVC